MLARLAKDLIQISFDAEMDIHLNENSLEAGANRPNEMSSKTMRSASASFELDVPRERNSSFEPQLVKKRQTILNDELDSRFLRFIA